MVQLGVHLDRLRRLVLVLQYPQARVEAQAGEGEDLLA
jgi:hypothetical protein